MLTTPRHAQKLSLFFLFCFTLLLTFCLSLPWVSAKEQPKPKPEAWQINGIVAALDDGHDQVKKLAFDQLAEYEEQDLKTILKKQAEIAQKASNILKDEKVNSDVRGSAAKALSKLGQVAITYIPDMAKIIKNEKEDPSVRSSAAEALGNLGQVGITYISDIAKIIKNEKEDSSVRSSTAEALGNLGQAGINYIPDLLNILKDEKEDPSVRGRVAVALTKFKPTTVNYIPDILNFLKEEKVSLYIRRWAATALGNLGQAGAKYIPDLLNILKDEKEDKIVRGGVASALGNLKQDSTNYIPDLANILEDEKIDKYVRGRVAAALGNLGQAAGNYIPDIVKILKDEQLPSDVREGAVEALGNLGQSVDNYVPDIADILKNEKLPFNLRSSAVEALGHLGQEAANYIPDILNFLQNERIPSYIRSDAAEALANLGQPAANYIPEILNFIKNEKVDPSVRGSVAVALGKIRKLELNQVLVILNNCYELGSSEYFNLRFLTYFLSGGDDKVKTLLQWLGSPQVIPEIRTHDEGVKILNLFLEVWNKGQGLERLRNDLAKQISEVAANKGVTWKLQDISLLQSHYNNLKQANSTHANAVQSAIDQLEVWRWFVRSRNTILTHAAFWLALIFAYPKFPQVQAIFFWNPWVRRILGVGYVGFLLTWVPFFRRKLFEPFKPSLLADAGLDNFQEQSYFPQSQVKVPSGDIFPVTAALPSIKGQVILQGDSGLGKSMFLRHLLTNSQRIVVYLPAQKCHKGVIEAIQDKLHGQAQDADFLKNLIYSGAIDICIDGLNEVTAETRAKICQFVESYFRGNIIMTTQPLEWTPPSTAKTYYLQPLEQTQIQEFLLSRQPRLPKDATVQGQDYEIACINYLQEVLSTQQPQEELNAARRILSNSMDLTVVALMLSQGKHPNLFRLQEQQYNLIAAEYLKEWNQEFPLKKFAAAVYEMRMQDKQALPADEFFQVVKSLEDEKYKMVVSRQWQDEKGEAKQEWYFRHDKIMDFFLVQNFLGNSDEAEVLLVDRMGDPRFRGVYFLLATLLPLDAAKELREKLIQYAADTKDNTVSNTFVQLLRTR
ncbi:HEAT repeat domain-containing protein [Aulosira sp. FACHB-615]|uniref:HEAT repeat domain-containing protein n=1 Tax=Aulosira sp. FACHB-615 TaxID=2692777 RepID=UPI001689B0F0|nr:HEAT repeat domain-containing protein [Aulosira sp. FACHB-615]MBD2486553.1 HEAT repeat domain-containing protein [Aulosira sp. FACHB-615]